MATPPPRFSTPSSGSQPPRSTSKAPRSASYAPASSAAARNARSDDSFLSPVSKYNRSLDYARQEQEARMKAIAEERAHRLATKQTTAWLSSGAVAQSSVKRKLTELETVTAATATAAAAQSAYTAAASGASRGRQSEPVKKIRTSSPPRSTTTHATASARVNRRVTVGHDGGKSSSSTNMALSASALKRHDERHVKRESSDRLSAGNAPDAHERYLAYEQQVQHMRPAQAPATPPQSHRSTSGGAHGLFARHNDPSVVKTPPSTTSSPFKFPDYQSSVSSTHQSPASALDTPTRHRGSAAPSPSPLVPRTSDGMVDLEHVSTVAELETLEGDDILSALMSHSTPRVDRHFPSEHSKTDSEEREIQFLRRRRLAASTARKSLDPNAPVVTADMLRTPRAKWSFDNVLKPVASPSTGAVRRGVVSIEAQQARDDAENAKAEAAENDAFLDEDDDDDDVSTELKVAQFSYAHRWGLRRFVTWVLAGAGIICALDIAFPLLMTLFKPPLPYCDNNTAMLGEMGGEATTLTLVGEKSEFTALQTYRTDCRACPLFGVCSNGTLVSCLPPLEERKGSCVESKEVQYALEQIAKSIERHVTDKATKQVCGGPPGLPSLWEGGSSGWRLEELSAARVVVLLSELKEVVLKSPFAETLMNISLAAVSGNAAAGYVFNRSLDLALSSFQKVAQINFEHISTFVGSNEVKERGDMLIQFSTSIAPWSCRARSQLLTHAHIIAIVVTVFALATLIYRRWLVYKTKRALVDRLVKEVRYFLLGRSHRTERFYPASHLRDNLFDTLPNVSPRDGKWLRESVWPTVAAIVAEDSRVLSHIAPIHGKQMVVWEWISSNSPNIKATEKKTTRLRSRRNRYSI